MFVGNEYLVDPTSVRFDQGMVEFNRIQSKEEYLATRLSIETIGQTTPIAINNETGLCENGRHRCRICIELGIQVKCIQVDNKVDRAVRIEFYNLEQFSGKDLTVAQRAVQAHAFAMMTKQKLNYAADRFKVDSRSVGDANTIAGLKRLDILDAIKEKGEWLIPGNAKPSKNLRAIASYLKSIEEEIVVTPTDTNNIDYVELIHTERGKSEFWNLRQLAMNSTYELSMLVVVALNYKYKLVVNETTGEVTEPT